MSRAWEQRLSLLERRCFRREIRVVREVASRADPAAALLRQIDAWQREAHRWMTSVEALAESCSGAAEIEVRALIGSWLRRFTPVTALPGDLAALARDLGLDAVRERAIAQRDWLGACTGFALVALVEALERDADRRAAAGARLRRVLRTHERPQTQRRAAGCLVDLLALEPDASWAPAVRRELVGVCTEHDDVWVRRQAVGVAPWLAPVERAALVATLSEQHTSDGALVREAALRALVGAGDWSVAEAWLDDPAEVVRFAALELAVPADRAALWGRAVRHAEPRTRAKLADLLGEVAGGEAALAVLARDTDDGVRRFALAAGSRRARLGSVPVALVEAAREGTHHRQIRVRREAERLLAWVDHHASPARELALPLEAMEEGERRSLRLPITVRPLDVAVALRPFALDGFGFTLRPRRGGVEVARGELGAIAPWRLLHELRNPAPAKRQGHTHSVGPRLFGPIQVPPLGLAEQSSTGVPGQRVQVDDGDWGPELPTLDDYRRALRWGEAWVVAPAGVVRIERPRGLLRRARASWVLLWRYGAIDRERLSALEQRRQERFRARLEGLGFAHGESAGWGGFLTYLAGTSGNTLVHLAWMLGLYWLLLMGSNVALRAQVLRHRRKLGLVVGGWGTRGKSGTERIKAGMLVGAGVPFVSKTTGCEAMILHGPRGDRVRELFLFRPYDKATIWEQADVLRFAAQSGVSAMIWECMALNPRYVDILQRGWMRDDLSTLTNAYPDHEDVMGPSGLDVARVIGSFAPRGSPVFTAEENMFPALRAEAARFGSVCTPLSTADKELIPTELIARFPYAEHPSNIALAARIGTELGLPRVEAMGWMADHVIPDLGALMVYPEVDVDGRRVVFVNGHSANDELSFTHSWRHTGFAQHRVDEDPGLWLIGVINNRGDRVPRSRVFARMAVRVAGAHRFLVIGTNLSGFRTFVEDALDELLTGLDLSDDDAWARWREHLKVPDPRGWLFEQLRERGVDPSPLVDAFESLQPTLDRGRAGAQAASLPLDEVDGVDDELARWVRDETAFWLRLRAADTHDDRRALLGERLRSRVVLLPDAGASGDQVVSAAAQLAPPGARVQMMGMQNIKGTGLDFVYQWVRWRTLHADLQRLDDRSIQTFSVKRLTAVFHCDAVLVALAALPGAEAHAVLAERVAARRQELLALRSARPEGSAFGRAARRWLWRVYDPIDAIWRRRRTRQVLTDLAHARIGHDDAEQLLAAITYRQKG